MDNEKCLTSEFVKRWDFQKLLAGTTGLCRNLLRYLMADVKPDVGKTKCRGSTATSRWCSDIISDIQFFLKKEKPNTSRKMIFMHITMSS